MGFIYCFVEKMSTLIRSQNEMTHRNDGPSSLSVRSKGPRGVGTQKGCVWNYSGQVVKMWAPSEDPEEGR